MCHLIISQLSIIMRIFVDENSQMKDLVGAPHRLVVRNIPYFVKTFFYTLFVGLGTGEIPIPNSGKRPFFFGIPIPIQNVPEFLNVK